MLFVQQLKKIYWSCNIGYSKQMTLKQSNGIFGRDLTEDNVQRKLFNDFRVSQCYYLRDGRKTLSFGILTYSSQRSGNRLLEQILCHNGSLFH